MSAHERPPTPPKAPAIRFGPAYSLQPLAERLPDERLLNDARATRHLRQRRMQVYFAAPILNGIRDDLAVAPRVERGGLLVGHPFRDLDNPAVTFTVVVGAIPQLSPQSSVGQFTVTPEMISRARLTLEHHFPGRRVVGWYHSHPGHGVFLSGQDMTIVRSIYNAPWQIAFVRDTLRGREGVFYGPEGTRLDGGLELKTVDPDFILAADLYGQLAEATPEERAALLARLRALVAGSPDLDHWRAAGRYQDESLSPTADDRPLTAELEAAPAAQPPAVEPTIVITPTDLPPAPTMSVEESISHREWAAAEPPAEPTMPLAPEPEVDEATALENAQWELYRGASLIKNGNVQSGLKTLRHLAARHRDMPGLQAWIDYGNALEQRAGQRRPGQPPEL